MQLNLAVWFVCIIILIEFFRSELRLSFSQIQHIILMLPHVLQYSYVTVAVASDGQTWQHCKCMCIELTVEAEVLVQPPSNMKLSMQ